jgi:hypothetical protein
VCDWLPSYPGLVGSGPAPQAGATLALTPLPVGVEQLPAPRWARPATPAAKTDAFYCNAAISRWGLPSCFRRYCIATPRPSAGAFAFEGMPWR